MTAPQTSHASIYAELLPNLRQISLAVDLPSPCDASTTATVVPRQGTEASNVADRENALLRVSHAGVQTTLPLPVPLPLPGLGPGDGEGAAAVLPIAGARQGTTRLAWRLPLAPDHEGGSAPSGSRDGARPAGDGAPWSAVELRAGAEVCCRRCGSGSGGSGAIVSAGKISAWKDLPDQGWAEVMEFWHCHKPDEEYGHDHGHGDEKGSGVGHRKMNADGSARVIEDGRGRGHKRTDEKRLANRGYGANSTITAQAGVGLVDVMTLLFAEEDCQRVSYSRTYQNGPGGGSDMTNAVSSTDRMPENLSVFCSGCQAGLGYFDFSTAAVTLFKWRISVQSDFASPLLQYSPGISECLAATLIASMARSGSSRSLILPISLHGPSKSTTGNQYNGVAEHKPFRETDKGHIVNLWVLNSSIHYISSSDPSGAVTPAIKLLYRTIAQDEADKMLDSMTDNTQEVYLPDEAILEIKGLLRESNQLLPSGERTFNGWQVGLLTRREAVG